MKLPPEEEKPRVKLEIEMKQEIERFAEEMVVKLTDPPSRIDLLSIARLKQLPS